MLALVLVLVASQAESAKSEPPSIDQPESQIARSRQEARKRLGISLAAGGGLGGGTFALAPGLTGEVGFVLGDRVALSLRVTGLVLTTWLLAAVAGFDWVLSDRFTLGGGVGASLIGSNSATGLNLGVPLRLTFSPFTRAPSEIARAGILLGLELAPAWSFRLYAPRTAVCLETGCPVSPFGFSGQLTFGYAWW